MKKIIGIFLSLIVLLSIVCISPVFAQETEVPKPEYSRGKVIEVLSQTQYPGENDTFYTQKLKIQRNDTKEVVEIEVGTEFQPLNHNQLLKKGTDVILAQQEIVPGEKQYVLADVYRLPTLLWLLVGFCLLVVFVAHRQGLFSIVGMGVSLAILLMFIMPQILAGQNPVLISLIGCSAIAVITVYLCHGFNRESHIALGSMLLTLVMVSVLANIAIQFAQLVGLGSEEAYFLQFSTTAKLNLQGLLLGGIMIGALGVLDDITIAQVSLVQQLKEAKPDITFQELYMRGLAVGKDHVASLVNTLVLAYAGTSLPLFLLFTLSDVQPHWVSLNSETIAEEVVHTLTGSIGLVLAVPLTTLVASYFAIHRPSTKKVSPKTHSHTHKH